MGEAFWGLLDRTRPLGADPGAHAEAITDALVAEGAEATVAFAAALDEALVSLYRWDLWGACFLAFGGCSDDAFEEARAWIIARGRSEVARAAADPEGYLVGLLAGAAEPDERWDELGLFDAEALLHTAGVAHERLTGRWVPASGLGAAEPLGVPWEEDELPERFPRLSAALPDGWWELSISPELVVVEADVLGETSLLLATVAEGLDALSGGDHLRGGELLGPLVDDPAMLERLVAIGVDPADVAYGVAISRLVLGDPDGAAAALLALAEGTELLSDQVRRLWAQIELTRGELGAAAGLLDQRDDAPLFDRALLITVRLRAGELAAARAGAVALLAAAVTAIDEHPWDLAGMLVQAGLAFVELGDADDAARAAEAVATLIDDAPDEVPLVAQHRVVAAGAARLAGDLDTAERQADDATRLAAGPTDLATAQREQARIAAARGELAGAERLYGVAVEGFASAGERWEAEATARERDEM